MPYKINVSNFQSDSDKFRHFNRDYFTLRVLGVPLLTIKNTEYLVKKHPVIPAPAFECHRNRVITVTSAATGNAEKLLLCTNI